MGKTITFNPELSFKPLSSILYVNETDISEISLEAINVELVGEKAFGLSCLPEPWTLPFIVVSDTLLLLYKNYSEEKRKILIEDWCIHIIKAALISGIGESDNVIVRSSGCSEGMDERGKFYSVEGRLSNLYYALNKCLLNLTLDKYIQDQKVPLVIQKLIIPISAKGHLSNERRCYEEKRDWLGEFTDINNKKNKPFKINLRNWRKKYDSERNIDKPLLCNISAHVSEILKICATWAYVRGLRVHFEWVWDGSKIYIVQADRENEKKGYNPTKGTQYKLKVSSEFLPKCLVEPNESHSSKFNKIENVFVYKKLGLPTTKLYILDDQSIIDNLASGIVPIDLEEDIRELVKGSLVIRIDVATDDLKKRQLLPRTQEERVLSSALKWLIEKSFELKNSGLTEDLVFIFHNFIPATSSAFAYAAPEERKVQIEALWGLPEGLYYNAHDKYVIDTQTPKIEDMQIDSMKIFDKRNYKRYSVSPEKDGRWTSKLLQPPYDWKGSIQNEEWIKEIAFESRRIANEVGKPLSIMWFVDVPSETCSRKVFPWYHEYYDQRLYNRARTVRTKTIYDESLTIRTTKDIEILRNDSEKTRPSIKRIRIQPCEDELLRNKSTLRDIGLLTQKINAVILLEGGVLSHAYYQLMETNAIVEVMHPFDDYEDKREFNKLVRDKISLNIEQGGELVNSARLTGEYLLRALREKLIEESFEVLDAVDQDSIISELADVNEVIEGILAQIKVEKSVVEQRQKQKREKAGGFINGIVLLDTRNPPPTTKQVEATLFDCIDLEEKNPSLDQMSIIEQQNHKIDKWSDKKQQQDAEEAILRLVIPMVRDNWNTSISERIDLENAAKIQLIGTRLGSKYQIELSVTLLRLLQQLTMFDIDES